MEVKHKVGGNMLSIFGMLLFISGIAGFGCAVWMAVSNNGGLLHWLSFLVGIVCIPVTALGYALIGEKERQEKAKTSGEQVSRAVWHEFVSALAFIFGIILIVGGIGGIVYCAWIDEWFRDVGGPVELVYIVYGGPSILAIIGVFLLVRKVFRGLRDTGKSTSKD